MNTEKIYMRNPSLRFASEHEGRLNMLIQDFDGDTCNFNLWDLIVKMRERQRRSATMRRWAAFFAFVFCVFMGLAINNFYAFSSTAFLATFFFIFSAMVIYVAGKRITGSMKDWFDGK